MEPYVLRREQRVPRPIDEVFPFFDTPENIETMTPPQLRMRIITPGPLVMRAGALFDYIVTTRGLPMRWTSFITEYDPPHRFIDVQLRGPYAFWHHTHAFEPDGNNTRITDEVRYLMPFGPIGKLAHALVLRRDLERIFAFRRAHLEERFGPETA